MTGFIGAGYLAVALRYLTPQSATNLALEDKGPVTDYAVGQPKLVTYKIPPSFETGVYIVNFGNNNFLALGFICTHLQCPVHWAGTDFFCPCHGSVYNIHGVNIAGPAPRPLYHHVIKIKNGHVYIGGIIA